MKTYLLVPWAIFPMREGNTDKNKLGEIFAQLSFSSLFPLAESKEGAK